MADQDPRISREKKTLETMIRTYCNRHHGPAKVLCRDCNGLLEYAKWRLDKCHFQEGKTTCAKCPVHCYKPDMREKIRAVMRYAGPRMTYLHPVMAFFHMIDGLRKEPIKPEHN